MATGKTSKKTKRSPQRADSRTAIRSLHRAKDGLREFAYTAAVCGTVVGVMMLLRQFV